VLMCLGAVAVAACALQRAQTAADAKKQMIGMTKEAVLRCMGAPAANASVGATEVWTYRSGDAVAAGYNYCNINVAFAGGVVSQVNYTGETGGLISKGEQCAYAVEHCVH